MPLGRTALSLATTVALVSTVSLASASPGGAGTGCVPVPVAHRGDSERRPENTLPAFRTALRAGVWRLETDVRFTADDVPVLMHDRTVGRTTDGQGEVSSLTFAQVRELDAGSWFSRRWTGVRVPAMRELLDYGRTHGAYLLLELKTRPTPQQMDNFLNEVRGLGMLDRVRVTSFDEQTILDVRAAQPGLRTAIIDNPRFRSARSVLRFGQTYIVHHYSVTQRRTARWKRAGIEVRPWTVDAWRTWRRMAWDGAGPVITNRPSTYLKWARVFCS